MKHKKTLGTVALLATIIFLITAVSHGGFWWLGVMLGSALALWGLGKEEGSGNHRSR